jgi:hypothetical protein
MDPPVMSLPVRGGARLNLHATDRIAYPLAARGVSGVLNLFGATERADLGTRPQVLSLRSGLRSHRHHGTFRAIPLETITQ